MAVRIGVVEDDTLLRTTLTHALSQQGEFEVVCATNTAEDILDQARKRSFDVALLDVHLGVGPTGFDLAQSIRRILPLVGIVFLSTVKDPRLLGHKPQSLPQGARYVVKSEVGEIEHLAAVLRESANNPLGGGAQAPSLPFTQAQIDILRLVAAGYSNSAIASERVVTEHAVEMAVSRLAKHLGLQEKPGMNQRVHIAATFFREMGWGSP